MKKNLSQDLSWQVLFLLGVMGIIIGRLVNGIDEIFGAVLGITGVIIFALGVINFLTETHTKRKRKG
jgi:Ca2+/Na+ antiporter